jgi:hypothetical protein
MVQSADLGELGEFCYFDNPRAGRVARASLRDGATAPEKTIG